MEHEPLIPLPGVDLAAQAPSSHRPAVDFTDFSSIGSACAIALHMHQPLLPTQGSYSVMSNLARMQRSSESGDSYNASMYQQCYQRPGELIPALVSEGLKPRLMLDYSGTLLYGLQQMALTPVLEALRRLVTNPAYASCVEWLGSPWGHAVAPSTPPQDYRLHVQCWREHFAALFGAQALAQVRGFSPAEMALPNHPDVAFDFVSTLREFGYSWVLVQEHTVEDPRTGGAPAFKHVPHRLVCQSSTGKTASIIALIKTQGSDTKLVGQMQPWYEAQGLRPQALKSKPIPPIVTQIADGENGGVMMNEFPGKYCEVVRLAAQTKTPLLNGTQYLDSLFQSGITPEDLPPLQPLHQKQIWDRVEPGCGPERLASTINDLHTSNPSFHMEGGSWTNSLSWVRGYESVLGPMARASALFHKKVLEPGIPLTDPKVRRALFYLLCSQTSCFRYWGEGTWTDYGREFCRRTEQALNDIP